MLNIRYTGGGRSVLQGMGIRPCCDHVELQRSLMKDNQSQIISQDDTIASIIKTLSQDTPSEEKKSCMRAHRVQN